MDKLRNVAIIAHVDHEVDLVLRRAASALYDSRQFYYSHVYRISPADQIVVNHIFHQVRTFLLAEIQPHISHFCPL